MKNITKGRTKTNKGILMRLFTVELSRLLLTINHLPEVEVEEEDFVEVVGIKEVVVYIHTIITEVTSVIHLIRQTLLVDRSGEIVMSVIGKVTWPECVRP